MDKVEEKIEKIDEFIDKVTKRKIPRKRLNQKGDTVSLKKPSPRRIAASHPLESNRNGQKSGNLPPKRITKEDIKDIFP